MVHRNVVVYSWEDQESKSACTYYENDDDDDDDGGGDGVAVRIKITCTGLSQRACASSPPRTVMVMVITLQLESRIKITCTGLSQRACATPAHHREKLWFDRMTVNKWDDRLYLDVLLALRWKKVFDKAPHISCGGGAINQVKWKPSRQIMLRRRGSFLLLAFWHIYALYHAERVILRIDWWS